MRPESNQAIYRTPVVASHDRVTSLSLRENINIQNAQGVWLGQSDPSTTVKTFDRVAELQIAANSAVAVHQPPLNPMEGQRIELLSDYSVPGGAILTAAQFSSSTAVYIGYLDASSRTQTTDLGSLEPENSNIAGLLSYPASHNNATFRDKTVFQDRGSYNPTTSGKVSINGIKYPITNLQGLTTGN